MVLDNEPIFENCLIKKNKKSLEELSHISLPTTIQECPTEISSGLTEHTSSLSEEILTNQDLNDVIREIIPEEPLEKNVELVGSLEEFEPVDILQPNKQKEENISIEFEDLMGDIEENNNDLTEINNNDLNLEKNDDIITLKKPNQVYFELYKEARKKAKEAKKNAILAYLEAKNIKKTYMIENMNDSDSDFDAELDEVSESELEGL
jgi:hypothetical protein